MTTARGEKKWHCRCDCGTERYVLERSLKYGGSLSCGCRARENARNASAHDLRGKVFGDLTVVGLSPRKNTRGVWWTCLCTCGYTCEVSASRLVSGEKTNCGCTTGQRHPYKDITGQRFHRLTALYRVRGKDAPLWHCRCDCGNEVELSYNALVYANVQSCGCKKKEHDKLLNTFLTHVAGTSLEMLQSQKLAANNTTGHRGVYFIRGKYVAKIVFQKKQYFLGAFDTPEQAAQTPAEAEELLFKDTVRYYEKWQQKAAQDPTWARDNPVNIRVEKTPEGKLTVVYTPNLI